MSKPWKYAVYLLYHKSDRKLYPIGSYIKLISNHFGLRKTAVHKYAALLLIRTDMISQWASYQDYIQVTALGWKRLQFLSCRSKEEIRYSSRYWRWSSTSQKQGKEDAYGKMIMDLGPMTYIHHKGRKDTTDTDYGMYGGQHHTQRTTQSLSRELELTSS